jgi:hypothetical protein
VCDVFLLGSRRGDVAAAVEDFGAVNRSGRKFCALVWCWCCR